MQRRDFIGRLPAAGLAVSAGFSANAQPVAAPPQAIGPRAEWLGRLQKLSEPLLRHLAADELSLKMPLEGVPDAVKSHRFSNTLEGFGRLMAGIAPWLAGQGGDAAEVALRQRLKAYFTEGMALSLIHI